MSQEQTSAPTVPLDSLNPKTGLLVSQEESAIVCNMIVKASVSNAALTFQDFQLLETNVSPIFHSA
jgi:hypothetical protein